MDQAEKKEQEKMGNVFSSSGMWNCTTNANNTTISNIPHHQLTTQRETMATWYRVNIAVTDVYEIVKTLGQGRMGEVYHVRRKDGGRTHTEETKRKGEEMQSLESMHSNSFDNGDDNSSKGSRGSRGSWKVGMTMKLGRRGRKKDLHGLDISLSNSINSLTGMPYRHPSNSSPKQKSSSEKYKARSSFLKRLRKQFKGKKEEQNLASGQMMIGRSQSGGSVGESLGGGSGSSNRSHQGASANNFPSASPTTTNDASLPNITGTRENINEQSFPSSSKSTQPTSISQPLPTRQISHHDNSSQCESERSHHYLDINCSNQEGGGRKESTVTKSSKPKSILKKPKYDSSANLIGLLEDQNRQQQQQKKPTGMTALITGRSLLSDDEDDDGNDSDDSIPMNINAIQSQDPSNLKNNTNNAIMKSPPPHPAFSTTTVTTSVEEDNSIVSEVTQQDDDDNNDAKNHDNEQNIHRHRRVRQDSIVTGDDPKEKGKSTTKKWVPRRRVFFRRHYACKTIATEKVKKAQMEELLNEIYMMRKMDHPYIIRLYEVYQVQRE